MTSAKKGKKSLKPVVGFKNSSHVAPSGYTALAKTARWQKKRLAKAVMAALPVFAVCIAPSLAGQLTSSQFQQYDPGNAASIVAGPDALYATSLSNVMPTQMNEGYTEVGQKTAAFNLITSTAGLQANLLTDIEPVVIGPGGVLYLTDGHHTFTALSESIYGSSNPTVYVNVIANYSDLTTAEFYAQMQADNFLLPLNNGVPQTVNLATGSPIPTSMTQLSNDVYRGLEYSILKNKSSKFFTTTNNILGAKGASTPGLDKMTGAYADFVEAQAYRNANGGLGLPYLSVADKALATQWNLNPDSATTMPGVTGTVYAYQLPGFILNQNIVNTGGISDATLATGAMDASNAAGTSFTGLDYVNLGTAASPIWIGTPNVGFVMEMGNDLGYSVTLQGANTYTGGTTITAGNLIIQSDAALGAAPTTFTYDPNNIAGSVQAANGIIFNSLSEGNGTLTIGTSSGQYSSSSPFATSRPIAVDGESATINVNGSYVNLNGPLVSLGTDGVGIGNADGVSDLTIDSFTPGSSAATSGQLTLSEPSPDFYGNIIIGNVGTPVVTVMSDAALGAISGPLIGQIELNGGTLQAGSSFSAPERNMFLGGGSAIDVNGFNTTWGTLSDTQRTLEIENSSTTTAGSITFSNMVISATAMLQLDGGKKADPKGETVTFTNGISRTAQDTLILYPNSATSLGSTSKVMDGTGTVSLVNGISPVWIVTNGGGSKGAGPYSFVTYDPTNGYVPVTSADYVTLLSSSTSSTLLNLSTNTAASSDVSAFALQTANTLNLGNNTLTLGDGKNPAGLILNSSGAISGGTIALGNSEGVIWLGATNSTISSAITGANGLTFAGSGGVTISAPANVSGLITIDSGTVTLGAVDVFSSDVSGILLDNTKTKPSAAVLNITANNQLATLNGLGSNSQIGIGNGAILTLGDTTNNLGSTISSNISETGNPTAGALTLNGSGLFDFSGGSKGQFGLLSGSSIIVNNSAQFRVVGNEFANAGISVVLNGASQLQFVENGGDVFANTVSGTGALHLMSGTLQITGTNNSYSGGTILEVGSTLNITTANLPANNPNITNAGGTVLFDQATSGTYSGVISDGARMGTGPVLSGSLIKDDSTGANSGNVTLTQQQAFTGPTYIEAGTLTLNAVDTLASSSSVILGRVGGCVATGNVSCASSSMATATLALGANNTIQGLASDPGNNTAVTLGSNTLTINPSTVMTFGGAISGTGNVVIGGAGAQVFSGANAYTGSTTINSGAALALTGAGAIATSSGVVANGLFDISGASGPVAIAALSGANTGAVNLGANTLSLTNAGSGTFAGAIAGTGGLTVGGGSLTLAGATGYTGSTTLNNGAQLTLDGSLGGARLNSDVVNTDGTSTSLFLLNGAVLTGAIDPTNVTIDSASAWDITASSAVDTLTLAGSASFVAPSGSFTGRTLTVNSLAGQGGAIGLYTALGTDNAATDTLVVNASISGSTKLVVSNAGGAGALTTGNGIEVIQGVATSTPSVTPFSLGNRVVAGPYEYSLYQGGVAGASAADAQNWYLRSAYRPETSLYTALPTMFLTYSQSLLDSLQERMGDQSVGIAPEGGTGLRPSLGWARVIMQSGMVGDSSQGIFGSGPKYNYAMSAVQGGLDLYRASRADGSSDHAGAYVAVGSMSANVQNWTGLGAGSNSLTGYTVGGYWTRFNASGWYTDAVAQYTWAQLSAKSAGGGMGLSTNGGLFAASLTAGKAFALNDGWKIEPQAQLVYQTGSMANTSDPGAQVQFSGVNSLSGRLGVRIAKSWTPDPVDPRRTFTLWARPSVGYTVLGNPATSFSSATGYIPFNSNIRGSWIQMTAGLDAQITRSTTVYASGFYQTGLGSSAQGNSYGGKIGVRITW